jgi:hypothetical protein
MPLEGEAERVTDRQGIVTHFEAEFSRRGITSINGSGPDHFQPDGVTGMQSGWGLAALVAAVSLILAVVMLAQAVGNPWVALAITLGPLGIIITLVVVFRGPRHESRRTGRRRRD